MVRQLEVARFRIVIMVDEFPSTIENIRKHSGDRAAIHFLQFNRTIRQESTDSIQFMYTGSIGLPVIVDRLNATETINDLNIIEVPPLSHTDARLLAQKILLREKVSFELSAVDYLLKKISWLMPFFIQLSVQELIDYYDEKETKIENDHVDEVFELICNRRLNTHIGSYHELLQELRHKPHFLLAGYYFLIGDPEKVEEHLKVSLTSKNRTTGKELYFNLVDLYNEQFSDFDAIKAFYEKAIAKGHAGAMNQMAILFEVSLKDFEKAEQFYLKAVEKEHAGP